MNITKQIKVDLINPGSTPIIHAVQHDSYSRSLEIELVCGGVPFHIPGNARAIIRYRKSDGSGGEYDTLPDGTCAWQAERNLLCLALAPSMLTAPGSVSMTVSLITDGQQLSIFPLRLIVDAVAAAPNAKSENYFYVTGFLPAPDQAKKGQYLRVSEVNTGGRVTALEAVAALPGSGGAVDETTVHEIVDAYLEENPPCMEELDDIRTELNEITSSKVSVSDIVDNLTTNASSKPLSAAQGVAVKGLIDNLRTGLAGYQPKGDYALRSEMPTALKNPNALTINGTAYDGSEVVKVDTREFVFTMTATDVGNEDGAFSIAVDKPFDEIYEAHISGRTVVCHYIGVNFGEVRMPVTIASESDFVFFYSPMPGASVIAQYGQDYEGYALEIISSIRIGEQRYDFEGEADFTDTINGMIDAKLGGIENGTY